MTVEMAIVLAVAVFATILFITELLRVDLVALIVMALLLISGTVTPEQGISGFSNTATVTVGAMFVLSAGLSLTGALNFVGVWLAIMGRRNVWLALVPMMLLAGTCSAFINNTAVVAILLPITLEVSRLTRISPSKMLMPLSFASMFGGVCTLIGTSTNLLINSIAVDHGLAPFQMFEFTRLGLIFFGSGMAYMLLFGVRLIPERRASTDLVASFAMHRYLTEVEVLESAKSVGKLVPETPLVQEMNIDVFAVFRNGERLNQRIETIVIKPGDILRVAADVKRIEQLQQRAGIRLKPGAAWRDAELQANNRILVEAVVAPNSELDRKTLRESRFRERLGANVLAVRHRGQLIHQRTAHARLRAGDALLIETSRQQMEALLRHEAFVFASRIALPSYRRSKMLIALGIIAGVVGCAALGIASIVTSAIAGCLLMVLTGCLTMEEAYSAIDWTVLMLLAGVLTLGAALENSGAAVLLSQFLIQGVGLWGPVAVVSALYLLTSLLTEAMSNIATAALLAPIAIAAAHSLGVDSRPFLMAVTFAASASFMTPVGYQTNTLIYGPGQYRFKDYIRVGAPLNILFWILATIFIPRFWTFTQ
jgi:di/tricarboxylate transporter